MTGEPVLVRKEGAVGRITLNRPGALHALTTAMCETIRDTLIAWRDDPEVELVLLDHAGERGFCAGGDIRMLADSGRKDGLEARRFFHVEYQVNALLQSYAKPVAAMMDGIVMGGGVGLALPARYRIVTERTRLAMPETAIGLFPDVGGGWYLPRLAHHIGIWLGLTGSRIGGADCLFSGLATCGVAASSLAGLKQQIIAEPGRIEDILRWHGSDLAGAVLPPLAATIDRIFGRDSLGEVLDALRSEGTDWAAGQWVLLQARSPQSIKVTWRQLKIGAKLSSFKANMAIEYRIACRIVQTHDFIEGVRAVIIDKDNKPDWQPATVDEVADERVEAFFHAPAPGGEWQPAA